ILFVMLVVYPMFNTIYLSFFNYGLTDARIRFIGVNNFIELMGDEVFWRALRNNFTILVVSVIVQVGMGLILAALIDRGIRWGKGLARTLNFVPVVMSAVAVAILWQLIYDPTVGLANRFVTLIGLDPPSQGWLGDPRLVIFSILVVACWQYTGYVMIIILAGMQSVSPELYEAAAIDGATEIQKFFSITLPSIRNVNIAVILITMIGAVKVFDLVYILTRGGPANASQVMGTYIYYNAFTVNRAGYASAISVVLLVFALILGFLQLRLSVRPREDA
ncbi:MAG TPA: sugar ABC transporter permease, partial [Caldilinea sp.]|nr:sugar ABC transporter permease [Caldilinea sp.]